MTAQEIRTKFLKFMESKGHTVIPSASLIPENDPTTLFISAGMHPLVPYFFGQEHPGGKKIANIQKCIRTSDIEEVGDNRHLTFFEMMGNWSFGDYFKTEAIKWSWEFLTGDKWLGLSPERIYVTVFAGDKNVPQDKESIKAWKEQFKKVGINAKVADSSQALWVEPDVRIFPLDREENWWEGGGQTAPGGADSEIFFDTRPQEGHAKKPFLELVDSFRFIEVWNNVFMEYRKKVEGGYELLPNKNVDTGIGVERTVAILNGVDTVFETELFKPLFEKISELSGSKYDNYQREYRIIADHLKAAVFILAEGITPSNIDQGYILRRLIRRAIRYAKLIGIINSFTVSIAEVVINIYKDTYFELEENKKFIFEGLIKEEEKFRQTLERGLKEFDKIQDYIAGKLKDDELKYLEGGKIAFDFYQTYGFPLEMFLEELKNRGIVLDKNKVKANFDIEMRRHQELSRTASAGKFAGGLADHSEKTTKLHTAAHLLLESLRRVLGDHVAQRGANITAERLRFDFSHSQKLTEEEIQKVQNLINEQIKKRLPVTFKEMTVDEAKKIGATGAFVNKYGEMVTVYTIGADDEIFSREICGGPHVENLKSLGQFRIIKEQSSSAGVRRIKAVLE